MVDKHTLVEQAAKFRRLALVCCVDEGGGRLGNVDELHRCRERVQPTCSHRGGAARGEKTNSKTDVTLLSRSDHLMFIVRGRTARSELVRDSTLLDVSSCAKRGRSGARRVAQKRCAVPSCPHTVCSENAHGL